MKTSQVFSTMLTLGAMSACAADTPADPWTRYRAGRCCGRGGYSRRPPARDAPAGTPDERQARQAAGYGREACDMRGMRCPLHTVTCTPAMPVTQGRSISWPKKIDHCIVH
jgi:hypothetical protein